ncbi:MAG: cysteine hydrolase [Clostridia bacterium]|nr:cysteine hydrolase [Clostridia bacterium]
MKRLLVVIDMQNDFVFGCLGTPEAQAILPAVQAKVNEYRANGDEIVFTRDTHTPDYLSTQEGKRLPVPHCMFGTDGWQIVDGLHQGEKVFDKPVFGSEALAEYVKAGGYDEVALVGVCTDICVLSNAVLIKTACPETPVKAYRDCCAGVTPESHTAALVALSSIQVEIL